MNPPYNDAEPPIYRSEAFAEDLGEEYRVPPPTLRREAAESARPVWRVLRPAPATLAAISPRY